MSACKGGALANGSQHHGTRDNGPASADPAGDEPHPCPLQQGAVIRSVGASKHTPHTRMPSRQRRVCCSNLGAKRLEATPPEHACQPQALGSSALAKWVTGYVQVGAAQLLCLRGCRVAPLNVAAAVGTRRVVWLGLWMRACGQALLGYRPCVACQALLLARHTGNTAVSIAVPVTHAVRTCRWLLCCTCVHVRRWRCSFDAATVLQSVGTR